MKNELLTIGPLTVYGYGAMIAVGILAAWFLADQRNMATAEIMYFFF